MGDYVWNAMAHAQKPDFVFRRNGPSPFKSAGVSVQSTTGSRGVRISGSNAGYTMFRGSVKGTGYPLHSPVSSSLPLPCVTVWHHVNLNSKTLLYSVSCVVRVVRAVTVGSMTAVWVTVSHTFNDDSDDWCICNSGNDSKRKRNYSKNLLPSCHFACQNPKELVLKNQNVVGGEQLTTGWDITSSVIEMTKCNCR